MLLGAHWAYVEIGWGGYWAWDPVENAALMPWLAATAFLHSVMVQEKKGMLKVWNMVLVTAAFALAHLRHFLTRSGVVSRSTRSSSRRSAPGCSAFIAVVLAVAASLIVWRLPMLRADHQLESVVSREATFLFNNLLLLALAFADPVGRDLPDPVARPCAASGRRVSTPYYNFFLVIFGLPLLAADRDRAADRVAKGVGRQPGPHVPLAGHRRPWRPAGCSACSALGSSAGRADGALAVRVRDDHDRPRVRPRHVRPAGDRRRLLAARRWSTWSAATGAATAATSCTWRSCCWWSA